MDSKKYLVEVDDLGKYFVFTKDFFSRMYYGNQVLKAVDHFQKPEDIIGRPVIGILYGFRNGTG